MRKKNFWGWGYSDYKVDRKRLDQYKTMLMMLLEIDHFQPISEPSLDHLTLPEARFNVPHNLEAILSTDIYDRASHTYGKSFRDIWRGLHGMFDHAPDYVAFPRTEEDLMALYDFASQAGVALIPYGGGTSVVGGVESHPGHRYAGCISVDMRHFDKILEVDQHSRTARIQAGMFGPAIESGLKPYGLTLRHYPQSFEFSTLGGWIATRSGGHFATLYTHIDEFVQSVRMVTPTGVMQSRRLPGSGAGPSEERLVCGSEGILGIITEASMRLQDIPQYKATQTVYFKEWKKAVEACRVLSQSGLYPTNARLVDSVEAMSNGLGDGRSSVLILGFESHAHSVDNMMIEALKICEKMGGSNNKNSISPKDDKADNWKKSFLEAPYLRDEFVKMGCIMETFETAVTWDQFDTFHDGIIAAAQSAIKEICGRGIITCRFTHLYPDGPAPYYTVIARGQKSNELAQWDEIKKIVSDKIIELGGTITHHHAVGKDHRSHYRQQQSDVFRRILKNVKSELDPQWILNPDVLIEKNN